MDFRRTFAKYLKSQRQRRNLSQAQFARLLGCAQATVAYYETGRHLPSREVAERISEALRDPDTALLRAGYIPYPGWGNFDPKNSQHAFY